VYESQLPNRRVNCPLVNNLLHLLQERFALFLIQLRSLLLKELIELGIVAVGIVTAFDGVGLETRRGIAESTAAAHDEVLELFVAVAPEKGGRRQRPKPDTDPHPL